MNTDDFWNCEDMNMADDKLSDRVASALPRKVLVSRGEVMRATGWSRYYVEQLEEAQVLQPIRWRPGSHRRYTRVAVLAVVKDMEVPS
jgi:hypothetical protein